MREMIIKIKNTAMVQPRQESSKRKLCISNLDLVAPRFYVQSMYFYTSNGSSGFFDPNLVKEALSRALIPYYSAAGRLRMDAGGERIEIDCNDEGVLFVEAETTSILDDFGDFAPTMEYKKLIPNIDCSSEHSSHPLLLVQVTHFKCGGVSVGVGMHHILADGLSIVCFMNSWARLARGLDLTTWPLIDQSLLRARDPPSPKFQHVEYEPFPPLLTPLPTSVTLSTRAFDIRDDLINALKANSKVDGNTTTKNYTSFEMLSGHIWQCVCKARGLSGMQPSKLYMSVDGRSRLKPNLPLSYFGNAIFAATPVALAGDLVSNPASYAAHKIRESVARMDDEYLRSALDYIELHPDKEALICGLHMFKSPNLAISSWAKLPIYEADFGWGRPTFTGPVWVNNEGCCFLLPRSGSTNGGLSLVITLEAEHMQRFGTYLYHV